MRSDTHAGNLSLDFSAGAETWVKGIHFPQPIQCLPVDPDSAALSERLSMPANAQPVQIFKDALSEFTPAAGVINILDSQQQAGMVFFRPLLAFEGRVGVADMKQAGRAGGKTRAEHEDEYCMMSSQKGTLLSRNG